MSRWMIIVIWVAVMLSTVWCFVSLVATALWMIMVDPWSPTGAYWFGVGVGVLALFVGVGVLYGGLVLLTDATFRYRRRKATVINSVYVGKES